MAETKKVAEKKAKYYERLGRTIESVFESGYSNYGRIFRINFVRGMFFGLGSAIGATIIVAIIAYILSLFSEVPFVGEITETVQNTLEATQ